MKLRDLFIPTQNNNFKAVLLRTESIAVLTLFMFMADAMLGLLPASVISAQLDMNSLVYLHNKERTQVGLNNLELNSLLVTSASDKANAMLETDCWDHYCPPGVSPWTYFNNVGYQYVHAGENLGEGFTDNSSLMRAWMNSPTHKANVLKPEYLELGVGFANGNFQGQDNNTIAVVHFGARMQPTLTPTPTVIPTKIPTPIPTTIATIATTPDIKPTSVPTPFITVTPVPTQQVTPTQITIQTESQPQDILDRVAINYPQSNKTYTDPITKIKGTAAEGISKVRLNINGKAYMETNVINSMYTFESTPDTKLALYEGSYDIKVEGLNKNHTQIGNIPSISFRVELTEPLISQQDIKVDELIQQTNGIHVVMSYMPRNINVSKVFIKFDNFEVKGIASGKSYKFTMLKERLSEAKTIELNIIDDKSDSNKIELEKQILQNQVAKILLRLDFPQSEETTIEDIATLPGGEIFKFDFSFLSLKGKINLFVLIFLLLLFIVDYIIISRVTKIDHFRTTHNHHLSIGLIVILIIMTLLSSGVGSVAIGLATG